MPPLAALAITVVIALAASACAQAAGGGPQPARREAPAAVQSGGEIGAASGTLLEKDSNLDLALRVEAELLRNGVRVLLTRRTDAPAYDPALGRLAGYSATRTDLQARIDMVNAARADVFVSLHSNGSVDPAQSGVEVWYNSARPFHSENARLAALLLEGEIGELAAAGYPAVNRGAQDDACLRMFQGRCFALFMLAPPRVTAREEVLRRGGDPAALGFAPGQDSISGRATQMPGALMESLFISNAGDRAWLQDDRVRAAIARGVASGILRFLAERAAALR